jgi:hypothetical protein
MEDAAMLDRGIVVSAVAEWFAHTHAMLGGTGHEAELRPLAPELGVLDVLTFVFHGGLGVLRRLEMEKGRLEENALKTAYTSIVS